MKRPRKWKQILTPDNNFTEEDYNQADEEDTPDEPPNVQPTYDEIRDFQSMY